MVFESREGKCAIHARFLKLSDIDVTLLSIEHSFKGPVLIIRNVFKYELGSPIRRSNDRAWRYTSLTFLASGWLACITPRLSKRLVLITLFYGALWFYKLFLFKWRWILAERLIYWTRSSFSSNGHLHRRDRNLIIWCIHVIGSVGLWVWLGYKQSFIATCISTSLICRVNSWLKFFTFPLAIFKIRRNHWIRNSWRIEIITYTLALSLRHHFVFQILFLMIDFVNLIQMCCF